MSEPVIKCENVYKIFGANAQKMLQDSNGNVDAKTFQENGCIVGVNNASFEVSKGEMLVVMGLSGSGKSTLLRCISRLTDATGGKIFIEGQDLLQLNNKLIRKEMQDEFLRLQDKLQKTIMFITHDFDEALKLADRIAIMKDGIIEQLDTPANIVLNPATEYVRKFTEEVPREKVLLIKDVMDTSKDNLGDLKVSKDEIIENVAEKILIQEKIVAVVDNNNEIIGSINPTKIINTVFGGRKNNN